MTLPAPFRWFGSLMRRFNLIAGGSVRLYREGAKGDVREVDRIGTDQILPYNSQMALTSSAVWACVRLIANAICTLPVHIFRETEIGKVKASDHPLYRTLCRQPNPMMTTQQWLEPTMVHLLLWGNAFTFIDRIDDEIIGLWPIQPDDIEMTVGEDRRLTYIFKRTQKPFAFPDGNIIHFRLLTLDGLIGLSPVDYQRDALMFEQTASAYAQSIYRNGGKPSGVLRYPGSLKPEQAALIRESWRRLHSNPNSNEIAVLEQGAEYQAVSARLADLEYIADKKLSVDQIARIFGVPPHLIGSMDKPTYASVEQQSLEFLRYTINPWIVNLEKSIDSALLDSPYFVKFNVNAFERPDISARYRSYATARQWGWMSVNDIRTLEDMNQIGPQGDVYLEPLNMIEAKPADARDPEPITQPQE